ncbi:phosphoserine transaminase [Candidatus Symbiobacter mobilis]|uniref:Phosphoserine aminotransferase n=1 Tax=Candidatus Symbiobacter mobilis CR TaxID=946483 RepID=U5NET5_9BURK|nr:phosphoserine transaminase [Candidatus Symbiobacter mobilis]AGX88679.1 phosphoserine aminotransferase [Candidatus Symbiobacter mobilis CR]
MSLRNDRNFSGGPGALPEKVLLQARDAMIEVPDVGLSILGISHRSAWFESILAETEAVVLSLLGLGKGYRVLLLQGGATQQFSMIPMTFLRGKKHPAQYLHTGYWSGKSIPEAQLQGPVDVMWSGESSGFRRLPREDELAYSPDAPYLHYVSNETVEGVQFTRVLGRDDVPRVCDMSSDFLSRPCEPERFALLYAHAQKNIGPAGVTVVVIQESWLDDAPNDLPAFLDYRKQIAAHSNLNTPPVFAIYATLLVLRWLRDDIGGLNNMAAINERKARLLYRAIDDSHGFYVGRAEPQDRSVMNVAFNVADPALEPLLLEESARAGFSGLQGHRAIGGLRASLYNALTLPAVEALVDFLRDFQARRG